MTDDNPIEMQVEIMKRLPVKSLAVFRSVSKAWKSMIDNPLFIADHTNFHQHRRLLIRYGVRTFRDFSFESEFKYVSINDDDTVSQHTVSNVPSSLEQLKHLSLVGTSQGLLCLFGYYQEDGCRKKTAVIWNPSLGKSISVDVPYLYAALGFGVRPDNCDPVIVLLNSIGHPIPVLVFTLSSRVWRVPRGNLPPKLTSFEYRSLVTDDQRIYWKAYTFSINLVVTFDMVSEDFTEIQLPRSVARRYYKNFSISKIKESLALLDYDHYGDRKPVCNVWMMVEDGASKSFTKLFTIDTPDASLKKKLVLGFSKNDQPIMETPIDKYETCTLEAYEPHTRAIKNLGINGKKGSFFCCSYTETLILLDQLDEQFIKFQLKI